MNRQHIVILLPDVTQVGGIEKRARWLAISLAKRGFPVTVACRRFEDPAGLSALQRDRVEYLELLGDPGASIADAWRDSGALGAGRAVLAKFAEFARGGKRLNAHVGGWQGDVKFICEDRVMLPFVLFAGKNPRKTASIAIHRPVSTLKAGPIRRLRYEFEGWTASRTVVLTGADAQLTGKSVGARPRVIPNPASAPMKPIHSYSQRNIVWVGRMVAVKRLDLLVEGFAIFHPKYHGWTLTIVGDGPERPNIEDLIRDKGLQDFVRLTGALADPSTAMRESSVFVLTSALEGWSFALCEAMSLGLCPVVTDFGPALAELLPSGVPIVAAPTAEGVADALGCAASDGAERARRGLEALACSQKFSEPAVIDIWVEFLNEDWRRAH